MRINEGDTVSCLVCGHTARFSAEWLRELASTYFTKRSLGGVYLRDLAGFKCSRCGANSAVLGSVSPESVAAAHRAANGTKYATGGNGIAYEQLDGDISLLCAYLDHEYLTDEDLRRLWWTCHV